MTNNLEDVVQLVMRAYTETHGDEFDITPMFELEVRKALMQKYCSVQPQHTYTLNPGTLTGTWTSPISHTGTRPCPPITTTTSKELLNG